MQPQFTGGPWIFGIRPDGSIWLSIGDRQRGPHYQADFAGTEHDARLTVAAPAMYAELERCRRFLEDMHTQPLERTIAESQARHAAVLGVLTTATGGGA